MNQSKVPPECILLILSNLNIIPNKKRHPVGVSFLLGRMRTRTIQMQSSLLVVEIPFSLV